MISIANTRVHFQNTKAGEKRSGKKQTIISVVILLMTSVVCITICSKCSPIYPFNNWDDINCFFTVGKAVANDTVMYKEIFEQKGPLLYFLFSLAYFISNDTFLGIYLIEIILCFLFLLISLKTIKLFSDDRIVYFVPLLAAIIYSSSAMSDGGSAEELCLPLIALCCYFGIRSLQRNTGITLKEWFAVGVTSGIVLWIKFSLLGFYIGFGLYFLFFYLKSKRFKELFKAFLSLISGVFIISLPIFVYFAINNAVSDLFTVYFYDNLFVYTVNKAGNFVLGFFVNLFYGSASFVVCYTAGFVLSIAGAIFMARQKKELLFFYLITFLFSFLLIYSGGRHFNYYSFTLSVYVPFGVLFIINISKRFINKLNINVNNKKMTVPLLSVLYILSAAFMFLLSPNTYMLKYKKDDLPQFKFNKIISKTQSPTMLNYGFLDGGFYTVSDIMPTCKYFCKLNIPYEEMEKTQDQFVENGLIDYVVTAGKQLDTARFNKYECVDKASFEEKKGGRRTYYLYRKTSME